MSRRLSQEARRKAIDAAQALVAELGIDRFTVDGVARRSGVAKTTLYRHWSSGTDLLIDAVGQSIDRVEVPDLGSLRAELECLTARIDEHCDQPVDRKLLLGLMAAALSNPELKRLKEAMLNRRLAPARQILERAVARGEIPPIDIELALCLVHGPFLGRMLTSSEPIATGERSELVEWIARGLGSLQTTAADAPAATGGVDPTAPAG